MLLEATEALFTNTCPAVSTSAQLVGVNVQRSGLNVSLSGAATSPLYLLLGTGTASATNFDICVPVGQSWDGMIGVTVWRGAVQGFNTVAASVGVTEV